MDFLPFITQSSEIEQVWTAIIKIAVEGKCIVACRVG